jgi:hypothetical protein
LTLIDQDEEFRQLEERHRTRLQKVRQARETAPQAIRVFLDRHFYGQDGRERPIACGRGKLAGIRQLLQVAVNQRLVPIPTGKQRLDGYDLRRWLKRYGVGIDCSGFVQQVLERLAEAIHSGVEQAGTGPRPDLRFLRCQRVYGEITGGTEDDERVFAEVPTPAEAGPGDMVVSRSHMRIVASADAVADGGIVLALAESTAAQDLPAGQTCEETDIGPRIIQVKYTRPNQSISRQTPLKKRLIDDTFEEDRAESSYVIGR